MRYRFELPLGDSLQGFTRLESDAIARDFDLYCIAAAGLDIQACGGIWRGGEFGEGRQVFGGVGVGNGDGGDLAGFVDEHGRGKAGEAAVVEMSRTPVVVCSFSFGFQLIRVGREIVEETGFRGGGCLDYVLEIAWFVCWDFFLGVRVTCSRYENSSVDDDSA